MTKIKRALASGLSAVLALALIANAIAAQAFFDVRINESYGALFAIPAERIFEQCADAVFLIETFDKNGNAIRTGSGFFITETGFAVSNLHVFNGAASASIALYDGRFLSVRGVHAVSEEYNLVVFSIDSNAEDWDYLVLADSDQVETGNAVYVIGSPLGYINTMTAGMISHTQRIVDGDTFIQFTAPISFGSGGSPMLNAFGHVVGVTSSSFSYGQNLNLAVPINHVRAMELGEAIELESLLGEN